MLKSSRIVWEGGLHCYAALLAYLVLSLIFFDHGHSWTTDYFGNYTDPVEFAWCLNWWPFALTHGLNPFISKYVWFPHGYDFAWSASVPLLAVLCLPITLIGGPVFSLNLLTILAPALSAWTAFCLTHYLTRNWKAAFIGGYLFGFSSYELGQVLAHLNLDFVCLVPLAVLLCVRYIRGALKRRRFILWMTLLLLAELGISSEIVATLCVFGAIAWLIFLLRTPACERPVFWTLAADIIISFALMVVLAAPYFFYLFKGLGDIPGVIQSITNFSADPLNYITPTLCTYLGHIIYAPLARHFSGDLYEQGAYLGLPLIFLMLLYFRDHLVRPHAQALLIILCVLAILSLGPWLHISGSRIDIPLPWLLAAHLPLLRAALPTRFTMYVALCTAIVASLYLAEPVARRWRICRFSLAGLACLCLVPNIPLYRATAWPAQPFFTPQNIRQVLGPNQNVLILPFGQQGPSMGWQLDGGMSFTQSGGYVGFVPKHEASWPIVAYLAANFVGPDFGDNLTAFCATHGIDYILIGPGTAPALAHAVEALNWPLRSDHGVMVIKVPPASTLRYSYIQGDYWPSGGAFSWMGQSAFIVTHKEPVILTMTGNYRPMRGSVDIVVSDRSDKLVYHIAQSTTMSVWLPPDTTVKVEASSTFLLKGDADHKHVSVAIKLQPAGVSGSHP